MPTINVRQVSEEVVRKLKRRAVANNRPWKAKRATSWNWPPRTT